MTTRSNGSYIGFSRTPTTSQGSASGIWDLRTAERQRRKNEWPELAATDPNFSSVSLLLHMDGTNGSTTFTDSSSNAATVTAVGNAQISTAQFQFGQSGLFDGTGDRLTIPSSSVFQFGTGDFTVEAWLRESSRAVYAAVLEIGNHLTASGVIFLTNGSGNGSQAGVYSNAFFGAISPAAVNTFYHIAWVRSSGSLTVYVDGVGSSPVSFTRNLTDTANITVGSRSGGDVGFDFNGYIDDLRVTKGVARYTANFTPPTAAFPDA